MVMQATLRYTVPLHLPEALDPLLELTRNLRWTWHRPTLELLRGIDRERFDEARGNPLRMLHSLPARRLQELASDGGFLDRVNAACDELRAELQAPSWYATLDDAPSLIAYFSPEFGVSEVLPQYSGGLGVLAGAHLKAPSDLGVPLVAVGLLYRYGYFRQSLNAAGMQVEEYEALQPA